MAFDPNEPRDDHGKWTAGGGKLAHGGQAHKGVPASAEYAWTKLPHGGHVLAVNGNLGDQVGHVMPHIQTNGKRSYVGTYNFSGTGNKPSSYSHHGSVQGAKNYVERNLGQFWEPPNIRKK